MPQFGWQTNLEDWQDPPPGSAVSYVSSPLGESTTVIGAGFVKAWVRSPREKEEVRIFHGGDQLEPFLNRTDIAVCLLPLTRETEGILCARTFAMMPKGAMVINVGRGKHVVEADLIRALDSGQLSYAALDALWPEPLPPESPLWLHPKVTVMPHVARRPTFRQLVTEIAANIRSLRAGGRLLQEIDKTMGY